MQHPTHNSTGQNLPRVFKLHHYVSLGVGYAIGLGWIFVPARMMAKNGPLSILLAILLSGVLLFIISKSYKALLLKKTETGGEIAFAKDYMGRGVSFAVFWLLTLGFLSYLVFYASFSGVIFESLFPSLRSDTLYTIGGSDFRLSLIVPGLLVGLLVFAINYISTRLSLMVQSISVVVLIALVLVAAVMAFSQGSVSNFQPMSNVEGLVDNGSFLFVVAAMMCWYLFGFSAAASCSEECEDSDGGKTVARAMVIAIVVTTVFYLIVQSYIVAAMPWQEAIKLDMPTAEVFTKSLNNPLAYKLILVAGFLGIITTLNTCIIACSRAIIAANRSGYVPASWGEVDESSGVPRNALNALGLFLLIGPFLSLSWLETDLGPISFTAAFLVTCLSALRMTTGSNKVKGGRWIYILGLIITLGMVLTFFIPGAYYHQQWPVSYYTLGGVIGIGSIWYFLLKK